MDLRLMRDGDIPAVGALLRAAYRNANDYAARLRRHLELEPEGWLVAVNGDALVGCAGATVMGRVGYVGLVGVDPARQRQGVATALMEALIAWLRARDCATILLDASDAGKPLYLGMGFVEEDMVGVWRRSTDARTTPEPEDKTPWSYPARIRPYRASDLADLIAFDSACYGAPRDRVIAAYVRDDPAMVSVARDRGGAILGYLLVQAPSQMGGPWLAVDAAVARALLLDALVRFPGLIEMIMAPVANHDASGLLSQTGFGRARTLAHMRLGAPLDPLRRQRVYGQAGLALG